MIVEPVGNFRTYMSAVNFVVKHMPENYRCCSINLHGPNGVVEVSNDAEWSNMIYQISMTNWMQRDVRCLAGLEVDMNMSNQRHRSVIVID